MAMFDFRRGVGYPILKYDYNGSKYLEHVRYIHKHIYILLKYIYITDIWDVFENGVYVYTIYPQNWQHCDYLGVNLSIYLSIYLLLILFGTSLRMGYMIILYTPKHW